MSEAKLGTIGLIHGYAHRAAHWDRLRPELEARGFDTIAVDLPVGNPDATYADYARAAAEAFRPVVERGGRIDLVPHSMGSQTVPGIVDILGKDAIRSIIHISGSLDGSSKEDASDLATTLVPRIPRQLQRNSLDFQDATLRLQDGQTVLNPAKIRELLFGDCDPETFIWALEMMRVQARPTDEPPLSAHALPGIPKSYILGKEDRIRDRTWAINAAGDLGMHFVEIDGGHSPAIARPGELAHVIAQEIRGSLLVEETQPIPPQSHYLDTHARY